MSCAQNNVFNAAAKLGTPAVRLSRSWSFSGVSFVHMSALRISPTPTLVHHKMPSIVRSFPKYKTCAPICLFGGKGSSSGENKAFSWDSLKDALRGLRREKGVEDMLKDQMRRREFGGDGGDGGGGGGDGGGGGGGSYGTEDEGFAEILDETLQVFLATIAFLFLYIYIIKGADLTMLAKDYIKYLGGGLPTSRLERIMNKWKKACEELSWSEEVTEDWLIRRIVATPTWWHRPEEIVRVMKKKMRDQKQKLKYV